MYCIMSVFKKMSEPTSTRPRPGMHFRSMRALNRAGLIILGLLLTFTLLWDVGVFLAGVPQALPWQVRKNATSDTIYLDVRTPAEFSWFRIPGAENMPGLLRGAQSIPPAWMGRRIIVVCMTGHRSPFVAHKLRSKYGLDAANMTWGMLGWLASGGETES